MFIYPVSLSFFQSKRGARVLKEKFKKVSYDAIKKNKTLSLFVQDEKDANSSVE